MINYQKLSKLAERQITYILGFCLEYCLVVGYPYLFMDLAARWLNFGLLVNSYTWTLMAVVGGARFLFDCSCKACDDQFPLKHDLKDEMTEHNQIGCLILDKIYTKLANWKLSREFENIASLWKFFYKMVVSKQCVPCKSMLITSIGLEELLWLQ